jgi:hypothetical protein
VEACGEWSVRAAAHTVMGPVCGDAPRHDPAVAAPCAHTQRKQGRPGNSSAAVPLITAATREQAPPEIMDDGVALEQRPRAAPESNGHHGSDVPDLSAAEDFVGGTDGELVTENEGGLQHRELGQAGSPCHHMLPLLWFVACRG